jgi:hypothetical protein
MATAAEIESDLSDLTEGLAGHLDTLEAALIDWMRA